MEVIIPRCAGLDVPKRTIVACFRRLGPDGQLNQEVRTFGTMTAVPLCKSMRRAFSGSPCFSLRNGCPGIAALPQTAETMIEARFMTERADGFSGTFSASADKRGQFQQWTPRQ